MCLRCALHELLGERTADTEMGEGGELLTTLGSAGISF